MIEIIDGYKLYRCPFCGQPAFLLRLDNGQYYPRCTGGGRSGDFCLMTREPDPKHDGFAIPIDAVRSWNMRVTPAASQPG